MRIASDIAYRVAIVLVITFATVFTLGVFGFYYHLPDTKSMQQQQPT